MSVVKNWMRAQGLPVDRVWQDIEDCIIKTLFSAEPMLKHNYRTCFPNHINGSGCFEV